MSVFNFHLKHAWVGLIALLFLSASNNLMAQDKTSCDYSLPGEVLNWNFGEKAQLQFSEETFEPISTAMPGNIEIPRGGSSISDEGGNLLFFSDGMRVWGSSYFEVFNGNELHGNLGATQSSIFIPAPDTTDKYYLFTADLFYPYVDFYNDKGIRYSVIERINSRWEITTEKNIALLSENAQKLTAVKHANGKHYWLLTHGFGPNKGGKYYAFLITENGIDIDDPVISEIGFIQDGTHEENNSSGYMKISPDGKKLALVIPTDGIVEVAEFNDNTGVVSVAESCSLNRFNNPLGVEFSANNKLLYVTTNPAPSNPGPNMLYQFDLTQLDLDNPVEIASYNPNNDRLFGGLQLAADGRIYIGIFGEGLATAYNLGVIYNPNRAGEACNFNILNGNPTNGLALLDGSGSKEGLPNFISSYLDIPHFWWQNHCEKSPTIFRLQNEANVDDVFWDFGVPGATDNQLRGIHTFDEAGTYTVTATENYGDQGYVSRREIEIYPLPPVEIGNFTDTIFILPNSSITLDAGEYDEYLWFFENSLIPNATQQTLDVEKEGRYKVVVTDTNCCVNEDEVVIWFANIYLPTAFRPKSDIPGNQTFKPLGAVAALNKFELFVYNRWGQLVFESKSPTNGWDGTINGQEAPMAAYVWLMRYESLESTFQAAQEVVQRGVINLIR